jgi:very-short-patch-repair endonuclease
MNELMRRARSMRRDMTEAELVLWSVLRRWPVKVRRQHVFYPFIVDFYIEAGRVVVEVDGAVHHEQRGYDTRRDLYLTQRYRLRVMRFANEDVLGDLGGVLAAVEAGCGLR